MANRIGAFITTVTTSGTQVRLSTTSLKVNTAVIQVEADNTGTITVGDSAADSATGLGITLGIPAAGTTPPSVVFTSGHNGGNDVELMDIWIDCSVNGDGVKVVWHKA